MYSFKESDPYSLGERSLHLARMLDPSHMLANRRTWGADMPAYLIADIDVTDPEGFKKYQEAVPATDRKAWRQIHGAWRSRAYGG